MSDLYDYRVDSGAINPVDNRADAQNIIAQIDALNLDDPTQAGQAQDLLNTLGAGLTVDKVAGQRTMNAIDATRQLANMSDRDHEHLQRGQYLDEYINSLAVPYSDAASFRQIERSRQIVGRTLADEFDLHSRKKKLEQVPFLLTGQGISMDTGSDPWRKPMDLY